MGRRKAGKNVEEDDEMMIPPKKRKGILRCKNKKEMGRRKAGKDVEEEITVEDEEMIPAKKRKGISRCKNKKEVTQNNRSASSSQEDEAKEGGSGFFGCYLLRSMSPRFKGSTYIGYTVNPRRRIRQHNGEVTSGAWRTKRRRPWEMVLCIYGFPTNVSALQLIVTIFKIIGSDAGIDESSNTILAASLAMKLLDYAVQPKLRDLDQFEWAWQHPTKSKAVREAALSFLTLEGVANKIKLAYTMLTLPAWQRLNLTVNFFSTNYTKHSAGCPTLPEHMKVRICSMDDLPCYSGINWDSCEHDDYDDEEECDRIEGEEGSVESTYSHNSSEENPNSKINLMMEQIISEKHKWDQETTRLRDSTSPKQNIRNSSSSVFPTPSVIESSNILDTTEDDLMEQIISEKHKWDQETTRLRDSTSPKQNLRHSSISDFPWMPSPSVIRSSNIFDTTEDDLMEQIISENHKWDQETTRLMRDSTSPKQNLRRSSISDFPWVPSPSVIRSSNILDTTDDELRFVQDSDFKLRHKTNKLPDVVVIADQHPCSVTSHRNCAVEIIDICTPPHCIRSAINKRTLSTSCPELIDLTESPVLI